MGVGGMACPEDHDEHKEWEDADALVDANCKSKEREQAGKGEQDKGGLKVTGERVGSGRA